MSSRSQTDNNNSFLKNMMPGDHWLYGRLHCLAERTCISSSSLAFSKSSAKICPLKLLLFSKLSYINELNLRVWRLESSRLMYLNINIIWPELVTSARFVNTYWCFCFMKVFCFILMDFSCLLGINVFNIICALHYLMNCVILINWLINVSCICMNLLYS